MAIELPLFFFDRLYKERRKLLWTEGYDFYCMAAFIVLYIDDNEGIKLY